MTFTVRPFTGSETEWDARVESSPGWTSFHRWGWKDVIENVFQHDCLYLAAYDSAGSVSGVLPLVHARSVVFGDYLVSMPFVNYGGPLGSAAAIEALVQYAVNVARERRVDLLELRCREPLELDAPVSHRKITCVLDLEAGNAEAVWEGLTSNVRRKVRRAEKEGYGVVFGLDQLDGFYRVFSRNMRALGTPTLPRRFFEALVARFPEDIWIGCAYDGGRPVAGGFGFQWGSELELSWVSALREYHRSYANMLLYWAFIERAANLGVRLFNFGRCTPGGGTHQFKQQWGSRDIPLPWYQPLAGRRAATPSPHERAFSWGPILWRRLPLVLTNAIGPAIVRMIP
ncbi:MAG TPA: FemAB family XrtA/PEP-CTERM system-associated protein [Gemmatimonadales bacterium]|nr:FemAB family XrtA/PEP-CTERM system-associated protein [Gemmatimonadales bacterium]